ncbi:MAG: hypothetical protein VW475_14720 [Curvibacter sp.]
MPTERVTVRFAHAQPVLYSLGLLTFLLARADAAMYQAKRAGRNRIHFA